MKNIFITIATKGRKNILFVGLILFSSFLIYPGNQKDWVVPDSATKIKNPVKPAPENIKAGKSLYDLHCKSCHGSKGKGDGTKSKSLTTSCGDFSAKVFSGQTDGSIFYKINEGKGDMPSFKKKIPDAIDIWSIVNYIRTLAPPAVPDEAKKTTGQEPQKKTTETAKKEIEKETKVPEEKRNIPVKDSLLSPEDSLKIRERQNVQAVLENFETAMNSSDSNAIAGFYTADCVYYPEDLPEANGIKRVRNSYANQFNLYQYHFKFNSVEIEVSGGMALIRASTNRDKTILINNKIISSQKHELMVLRKDSGEWKIYLHMFN